MLVLVRVVNGRGDLPHELRGAPRGQRPFAHRFREILPLDVVHREVVLALALAGFVDGDDVGVMQAGRRFRLGPETQDHFRAAHPPRLDHLHRHDPVEAELAGAIHDAHAAFGDLLQQFVVAERAPSASTRLSSVLRLCSPLLAFRRPAPPRRRATPELRAERTGNTIPRARCPARPPRTQCSAWILA